MSEQYQFERDFLDHQSAATQAVIRAQIAQARHEGCQQRRQDSPLRATSSQRYVIRSKSDPNKIWASFRARDDATVFHAHMMDFRENWEVFDLGCDSQNLTEVLAEIRRAVTLEPASSRVRELFEGTDEPIPHIIDAETIVKILDGADIPQAPGPTQLGRLDQEHLALTYGGAYSCFCKSDHDHPAGEEFRV